MNPPSRSSSYGLNFLESLLERATTPMKAPIISEEETALRLSAGKAALKAMAMRATKVYSESYIEEININSKTKQLAAREDGNVLQHIDFKNESLNDACVIALDAVKQNGNALQHINLKDVPFDKKYEIFLAAVTESGYALQHVNFHDIQDVIVNDIVVRKAATYIKNIVITAVSKNGGALKYAPCLLKDNQEVVLAAIRQNAMAIYEASDRLKCDETILLAAEKKDKFAHCYARMLAQQTQERLNIDEIPVFLKKRRAF